MPKFIVQEKRCFIWSVLIDAADEDAAGRFEGDILEEAEGAGWGEDFISVESVGEEREEW